MLLLKDRLEGTPIMSLQTGSAIAQVSELIIDPRQLKVVAFYCEGPRLDVHPAILHASDIRELSDVGLIVDSADVIMQPDDLVRLKEILAFKFVLDHKQVATESGSKLGKVATFTLDNETLFIVKLHVRPGGLHAFKTTEFIIDRSQIVQVTDHEVIVKDLHDKVRDEEVAPVAPVLDNPFRRAPAENPPSHAQQQ